MAKNKPWMTCTRANASGKQLRTYEVHQDAHQLIVTCRTGDEAGEEIARVPSTNISELKSAVPAMFQSDLGITVICCSDKLETDVIAAFDIKKPQSTATASESARDLFDEIMEDIAYGAEDPAEVVNEHPGVLVARCTAVNNFQLCVVVEESKWAPLWVNVIENETLAGELLYEYGFYSESDAPVSWDGRGSGSVIAGKLLLEDESGDDRPGSFIWWLKKPIWKQVAERISDRGYELEFVFAASDLPGLDPAEKSGLLNTLGELPGKFARGYLSPQATVRVVSELSKRNWMAKSLADALKHPTSVMGTHIYELLRRIAAGARFEELYTWHHVAELLQGDLVLQPSAVTGSYERGKTHNPRSKPAKQSDGSTIKIPKPVQAAVSEAVNKNAETVATLQRMMNLFAGRKADFEAARATLGLEPNDPLPQLSQMYEMVAANPGKTTDYWLAFHTLNDADLPEHDEDETQRRLEAAKELENAAENYGWPAFQWGCQFMPIWEAAGGTAESARAWAERGWPPTDVLLNESISGTCHESLGSRLQEIQPPSYPGPEQGITTSYTRPSLLIEFCGEFADSALFEVGNGKYLARTKGGQAPDSELEIESLDSVGSVVAAWIVDQQLEEQFALYIGTQPRGQGNQLSSKSREGADTSQNQVRANLTSVEMAVMGKALHKN